MVPLCRKLATNEAAGIPLARSLEMIGRIYGRGQERKIALRMSERLRNGASLADAARAENKYFPAIFTEFLATGEMGGHLDVSLHDLAQYFEGRVLLRRKIVSLLIYPVLQLVAAWFLGTLAYRIIGEVMKLFAGTQLQFSFSAMFHEYLVFQGTVMLICGIIFLFCIILARLQLLHWIWGAFSTYIWPLSPITRRFAMARFCRCLSLLLGCGLRIDYGIERAAAAASNPYITRTLLQAVPAIRSGATMEEAFKDCRYLDPTARELLHAGELAGELEQQLKKISDNYMEEATHAVNMAVKVLQVVTLLVVALIIGYIIVSLYIELYGGMTRAFREQLNS